MKWKKNQCNFSLFLLFYLQINLNLDLINRIEENTKIFIYMKINNTNQKESEHSPNKRVNNAQIIIPSFKKHDLINKLIEEENKTKQINNKGTKKLQ